MTKTCICGRAFETSRANAKWCGDRCRKRAKRSGADVVPLREPLDGEPGGGPEVGSTGPIEAAARRELEAVDRHESALGLTAIAAARKLDQGAMETGSAWASLSREFEAKLAAAKRGAAAATAPQALEDEVARRRAMRA